MCINLSERALDFSILNLEKKPVITNRRTLAYRTIHVPRSG